MDYETLANTFLAVFEEYKTDEVHVFTISPFRNDLVKFLEFLTTNIVNKEMHISFNGLDFDMQITMFIVENQKRFLSMRAEKVAYEIFQEAQAIIQRSNNREFQKHREKTVPFKQIDVYKLNHWNNPAKGSSLKSIQCSINWHNVQDMPFDINKKIDSIAELQKLAKYCRNDVSSTKAIMTKCSKEIKLRLTLSQKYKLELNSASEPKLGKDIFLLFLSRKLQTSAYDLKSLRTFRSIIEVRYLLLPYLDFKGITEFNEVFSKFKNLKINAHDTKNSFKFKTTYKRLESHFGLGGLHGARKGIYESSEDFLIMTSDVISYYPNLIIRNRWAPAHLPVQEFVELYEWFFNERKKIPKSDPTNYVYKILLNCVYGLSNDKNSFFYDPLLTMKVTINGQLSLLMLNAMILTEIPGSTPIMQNTDGLEIMIPVQYRNKYLAICNEWEKITNLQLEHDQYQKLVVPDVNSYIGVFTYKEVDKELFYQSQKDNPEYMFKKENGKYLMAKTKCKGRFEFKDKQLHKNHSHHVIPKALFQYFINGVMPEDYLKTNNNIFDYCIHKKIRGNWRFVEQRLADDKVSLKQTPLQKTLRYYISNRGCKIMKVNKYDNRVISTESGPWLQQIYNVHEPKPFKEYNINKLYYLTKIRNEIRALDPNAFVKFFKLNL